MKNKHGVLDIPDIKNFRNLNTHQRTFVAKTLIDINELQISPTVLIERLARNDLLTIFFNEQEFVCLGLKDASDRIIEAILTKAATYDSKDLSSSQINAFVESVKSKAVYERGWALNHSERRGALALLESGFDELLRAKNILRSNTFCTVVTTNPKGNASAVRAGYKLVGNFPSPYSDNILSLYIGVQ